MILATPADRATAAVVDGYEDTPNHLPIDLSGRATLDADPGAYLLAVDATWEYGKLGWANDGSRETARFFFPIDIVAAAQTNPSEEATPSAAALAPIVVTSPSSGAEILSPVTVSGTADVFEGTVTVWIFDATGNRVASAIATATCSNGCMGTFSVDVPFSVGTGQPGEIRVFEESPEDGSRLHTVRIPVTLLPGPEDPVAAMVEGPWADEEGNELPDGMSPGEALVMNVFEGADHCGWTSVTFMHLGWPVGSAVSGSGDWRQFVRDPRGLLDASLRATFEAGGEPPDDAASTGYHRDDWELWIAPSDHGDAVYVVRGDPTAGGTWERWPRSTQPMGCR